MKKRPLWTKYFVFYVIGVIITALVVTGIMLIRVYSDKETIISTNANNVMYFSDLNLSEKFVIIEERFGSLSIADSFKDCTDEIKSIQRGKTNDVVSALYAEYADVLAVFYVDNDGFNYSAGENIGGLNERFDMISNAKSKPEYEKRKNVWFYSKTTRGYNACVLFKEIIYVGDNFKREKLGEILIYIDTDKINDEYFSGVEEGTGVLFVDCNGVIAIASSQDIVGQRYSECFTEKNNIISDNNGGKYFFNSTPSRIDGWKNISYFDTGLTARQTYEMFAMIIFAIIMCIGVMGIVSYFVARKIGKPVEELFRYIRVSNDGEVIMPADDTNNTETQEIKNIFDSITQKLHSQISINYQNEIEIKNALIKSYESQMNPHFLYNTLQIIQMLSIIGRNEDVNNITTYLGNMLRFNLDNSGFVEFGKEIENIENYFKILKLRYMDGFDYKILVDESLYSCQVVKFILQPFVENAINHGFKNKKDLWEIVITAREINGDLAIVIRDNGEGISKDRLMEIKEQLARGEHGTKGIGMNNVNLRIKLTYGKDYGVDIFSNSTTQVIISVPCIRDRREDEEQNV